VPRDPEKLGKEIVMNYAKGMAVVLTFAFLAIRSLIFISGGKFWPEPIRFLASDVRDGLKFVVFVLVFRFGREGKR
jgi:hypothetical protein